MRTTCRSAAVIAALSSLALAQDCTTVSVGTIPLPDLADGTYLGSQGGLYPGGALTPPRAHEGAGMAQSAAVVPRDAAGNPSPGGAVVLLSIGMSNTTQEFSTFVGGLAGDPTLSPALTVVDGAQGGQAAEDIDDPTAPYWSFVDQRLAASGVSPLQVQVVWLKEANRAPTAAFPGFAQAFRDQLRTIVQIVKARYPNTRICYLSSRTYAGYATTSLNPEPWAYESGFGVKWLIEDQINGDPRLRFTPGGGPALAPWLAWGPYLWTDGENARSDALVWQCQDVVTDGTHPSPSGQAKVAQLLDEFFRTEASAKTWFLAGPQTICVVPSLVRKYGTGAGGPNGIVQLVASRAPRVPSGSAVNAHAHGAPSGVFGAFLWGFSPLPDGAVPFVGGSLVVLGAEVVPAVTDGWGKASLVLGAVPDDPTLCGVDLFVQFGCVDADSPGGFDLSRGLHLGIGR